MAGSFRPRGVIGVGARIHFFLCFHFNFYAQVVFAIVNCVLAIFVTHLIDLILVFGFRCEYVHKSYLQGGLLFYEKNEAFLIILPETGFVITDK